jgi:hypothetical protein
MPCKIKAQELFSLEELSKQIFYGWPQQCNINSEPLNQAPNDTLVYRLIINKSLFDTAQLHLSHYKNLQELEVVGSAPGIFLEISKLEKLQILVFDRMWVAQTSKSRFKPILPDQFWNLKNLRILCIGDNESILLSERIRNFTKLETVLISTINRNSTPLPLAFLNMPQLKNIILDAEFSRSADVQALAKRRPELNIYFGSTLVGGWIDCGFIARNYTEQNLASRYNNPRDSIGDDTIYKTGLARFQGKTINGVPVGRWVVYNRFGLPRQIRHYDREGLACKRWVIRDGGHTIRHYKNDKPCGKWKKRFRILADGYSANYDIEKGEAIYIFGRCRGKEKIVFKTNDPMVRDPDGSYSN